MSSTRVNRDVPKGKLNKEGIRELRYIFKYLKPHRKYFIGGLIFISLSAISTLTFPFLIGKLIGAPISAMQNNMLSGTIAEGSKDFLHSAWPRNLTLFLIFIQLAVQTIFSYMRVYLLTKAGIYSSSDLRKELFAKLVHLPMSFFSQHRVGELSSRISADTGQIQDTISFVLAEFLRGIFILVCGVSFIFFISWQLALVMLSVVPLIVFAAVFFGTRIRKMSRKETDMLAESNTIVHESLQGISVVKAFTNENIETQRYNLSMNNLVQYAIRSGIFRGSFVSFIIFTVFGAIAFVVWYGTGLIERGELNIAELIQFVIYSAFVGGTLGGFANMFGQLQKSIGSIQRVKELSELSGEVDVPAVTQIENTNWNGEISFKNISFQYPSRQEITVLNNISFTVKAGNQVALVGGSGGGKSTIAALIMRFYQPSEGSILLDNKNIQEIPLHTLRNLIAYVPQEVMLFGGTIYENILYGKPSATREEVIQAATQANALQFIESFPQQFETIVGERGIQLSGGQKQRIAIARAVLKNPTILILDEATSALDSESELLVQEALDKLMLNRTSIVIAHRLSTIRNAHNIIVLDKGKIHEQGNHQQLMQYEDGIYHHLIKLQNMQ